MKKSKNLDGLFINFINNYNNYNIKFSSYFFSFSIAIFAKLKKIERYSIMPERMVKCIKLGKVLPGLKIPPTPTEIGQKVFENRERFFPGA